MWGRAWGGPAITLRVGALAVRRSPGSRTDAHRPASIPVRATTVCTSVHSPDFVCDFHALLLIRVSAYCYSRGDDPSFPPLKLILPGSALPGAVSVPNDRACWY